MYLKKIISKVNTLLEYPILFKTLNKADIRGFMKDILILRQDIDFEPKTIIDIGAARGQWSQAARMVYPETQIYAFEPILESYKLMQVRMINDIYFHAFNFGLADKNSKVTFGLNSFPDSSSILKMTEIHKKEFPFTEKEKLVEIDCFRLDSIPEMNIISPAFLKMDVQGAELIVLKGAGKVLEQLQGIQLELNFETFYESQVNYKEIFDFMFSQNFKRFFQIGTLKSNNSNKILACDMVFLR
jgi:FkbM family methyltransferase